MIILALGDVARPIIKGPELYSTCIPAFTLAFSLAIWGWVTGAGIGCGRRIGARGEFCNLCLGKLAMFPFALFALVTAT